MERKRVGVLFGGVSPEHEVSIISAHQVLAAMDRDRFDPVAVYVGKDGKWFTGGATRDLGAYSDLEAVREGATEVFAGPAGNGRLRLIAAAPRRWFSTPSSRIDLDVVFPAFHGGSGEDGGIQGLCDMHNVACAGSGVLGSALGMDKIVSKVLSEAMGIPVVEFVAVEESDWADREDVWLDRIEQEIGLPAMVKPARLGSSIGITLARDRSALDAAVEEAFRYGSRILVERAIEQLKEVNCSVMGSRGSLRLSVLEEPVRSTPGELLSFADKYQRGAGRGKSPEAGVKVAVDEGMASLDRIIPARISPETEAEVHKLAEKVFRAHDCSGVVRIDFLLDQDSGRVFFNEVNTIPGSFSFYLWEPAGVSFPELITHLIEFAVQRHRDTTSRIRSYDVNLLSSASIRGLKGAKRSSRGTG